MSTRWYPLYQQGNPQLRVFLPNFFLKLVRPKNPLPSNIVTFHVSMQMTKSDIKNYLEKIYKIPVVHVEVHNQLGKFKRAEVGGYIVKEDDIKVAFVTLPPSVKFEFPNICQKKSIEEEEKKYEQLEDMRKEWKKATKQYKHRLGIPTWFSL